jgi:hypothetical protein
MWAVDPWQSARDRSDVGVLLAADLTAADRA